MYSIDYDKDGSLGELEFNNLEQLEEFCDENPTAIIVKINFNK